jgi:hypothetical protein
MNTKLIRAALGLTVLAAVPAVVHAQTLAQTPAQTPSAEEIVIKEKLRASGLKDIRDLTREKDGTWRAKVHKDNAEVAVVVDTDGNVKFQ